VLENMARAAARAGRDPSSIKLLAASKGIAAERVAEAIKAGVRDIGENRLQEALRKIGALGSRFPDLQWHFIGTLQRRKVKAVVGTFKMIHSVDTVPLAEEINRQAGAHGVRQRVLLEVNVGRELSKAGFSPSDLQKAVQLVDALPNLQVDGLMTVPPYAEDPESARPYFRQLRDLARKFSTGSYERVCIRELSMGMSEDYEVAIEEGATLIRVGRAIFGARDA